MEKKKKKVNKRLSQPYSAIRNYLKKNGWNVVVIGGTRITQGYPEFNFHFECDFTGSRKS